MITGKTKSGFVYAIPEKRIHNMELLDALVDWQKEDKLFENQQLFRTPIVRNGKEATVGYCPDVWAKWE